MDTVLTLHLGEREKQAMPVLRNTSTQKNSLNSHKLLTKIIFLFFCFSFLEHYLHVERANKIEVKFQDIRLN